MVERAQTASHGSEIQAESVDVNQPVSVGNVVYSDVSTREIHEMPIEKACRDFRNSNIQALYVDLGLSGVKIARIVGVSGQTIYARLRKSGVTVRPALNNPESERLRTEGMRRAWADNKEVRLAKMNAPELRDKRSSGLKRVFQDDATYRESALENLARMRSSRSRQAILRRDARIEQERQQRQQRATEILEDPTFSSLAKRQQELLRLRYPADGTKGKNFGEIGTILGGITRERVRQIEVKAFRKLGIARVKHNRL